MRKADFKKPDRSKDSYVKWTLNSRKVICMSLDRKRWCKKYLTRSYRRKSKQGNPKLDESGDYDATN